MPRNEQAPAGIPPRRGIGSSVLGSVRDARLLLVACMALAAIGCDPATTVTLPTSASSPQVGLSRGGRGTHGLGRNAEFFAFADSTSTISETPSPFRLADIREASGVDFIHVSGNSKEKLYPTAFGSGVALFDYDGDGRLDIYLASFNPMPPGTPATGRNRLFRNLGGGKFRDATDASGLGFAGYCHGIIAGDLDNDGDTDVFLCNYGANALYLNRGDGTYREVGHAAGIDAPNWSMGGAMLDYDGDGDLDIYVANYGEWIYPRDARRCGNDTIPLFCSPWEIKTVRHILYRNDGNLRFADVTEAAGISRADGHGFGAVAADLNGDSRVDLYVPNDMNPNFLFLNRGDGTFEDATESSGAAFDERGFAQSSMGVDAEDCDGDGLPELIVTNFHNEHIAYYRNLSEPVSPASGHAPSAVFRESAAEAGLTKDSRPWIGWGCALADLDNDGWPDFFAANGHLDQNRKDLAAIMSYPQPPLLFRNVATGGESAVPKGRGFELSTRDAGAYFLLKHVGRGAAFGDLDDDGDLDIVVNHMDAPPAILRNDTPQGNHWIRLKLVGTRSSRDAIGARVEVKAGDRTIARQRKGGCSMQSTNDPRLLIGVGAAELIDRLTVRWPSGAVSILERPKLNTTHEVVEPTQVSENGGTGRLAR